MAGQTLQLTVFNFRVGQTVGTTVSRDEQTVVLIVSTDGQNMGLTVSKDGLFVLLNVASRVKNATFLSFLKFWELVFGKRKRINYNFSF